MLLISVMAAVVMVVVFLTIWILYQVGYDQQRSRLVEVVQSQARLIEAISQLDAGDADSEGAEEWRYSTIDLIRAAHDKFMGFGETGEFSLGQRVDDEISFLLSHRHGNIATPEPIPLDAQLAEPMRRALSGHAGVVVGQDYRGIIVLAAHEPIAGLGWGIVAKIDMVEIRAPYIKAAGYALIIAVMAIGLGSGLFLHILRKVVTRIRGGEQYNRMLFEESPIGLALCSMDGELVDVNPAYASSVGRSVDEVKSLTYWEITPKKYQQQEREQLQLLNKTGRYGPYEKEYIHRLGYNVPVRLSGHIVVRDGEKYIWSSVEDISEQRKVDEARRLAATVFDHSDEGIVITDDHRNIIMVNKAFTEITGYRESEVLGQNPRLLGSGEHGKEFFARVWERIEATGAWRGEVWNRRKSGEVFPVWQHICEVRDDAGLLNNYVSVFCDISDIKRSTDELSRKAHYDELTGLPNRCYFNASLEKALHAAKRSGNRVAVIFVDLDGFKDINDTMGHDAGDLLLQQLAERMRQCVREEDTVARIGGDEFTIFLKQISNAHDASLVAAKLVSTISKPATVNGAIATVSASVGIALYPTDAMSPVGLLKAADLAMYKAKEGGKNDFCFYADEDLEKVVEGGS